MDKQLERDIKNGRFKSHYLVYLRKSTDEPDSQQNSLSYQRDRILRHAKEKKLILADLTIPGFCTGGVISEKHSSFKEDKAMYFDQDGAVQFRVDRPKFYRLASHLNQRHFKGVLILSWDRASRNPTDNNILKKLIKGGVDVEFALAKYERGSSGDLHMDIDGMFAEHHSRVTSEKVNLALEKLRGVGKWTNMAPVGYLNEGNTDWKPFDPLRAPVIKRFFELADEGWTLADIAKWANEMDFTMPPRRPKRTWQEMQEDEDDTPADTKDKIAHKVLYTTIQPILRNRFYTGRVLGPDKDWVQSNCHEPLVSDSLFERVQAKLSKRNKSRKYDQPLEYPFRNIFTCADCGRSYTPYVKKGIIYCQSKCKVDCSNKLKNVNLNKLLTQEVRPFITRLRFTEEELLDFERILDQDVGALEEKRANAIMEQDKRKYKIREDLRYLRENKAALLRAGTYTPEELVSEMIRMEAQIGSIIEEEQISELVMAETMRDAAKVSELLKSIDLYWDFADLYEKEAIVKIICSELLISQMGLIFKANIGLQPFQERFYESSAANSWIPELFRHRNEVRDLAQKLGLVAGAWAKNMTKDDF